MNWKQDKFFIMSGLALLAFLALWCYTHPLVITIDVIKTVKS